jgi:hypothetical protein
LEQQRKQQQQQFEEQKKLEQQRQQQMQLEQQRQQQLQQEKLKLQQEQFEKEKQLELQRQQQLKQQQQQQQPQLQQKMNQMELRLQEMNKLESDFKKELETLKEKQQILFKENEEIFTSSIITPDEKGRIFNEMKKAFREQEAKLRANQELRRVGFLQKSSLDESNKIPSLKNEEINQATGNKAINKEIIKKDQVNSNAEKFEFVPIKSCQVSV